MTASTPGLVTHSRRWKVLRRIAIWGETPLLLLAAAVSYLRVGHMPHVWAYDSAYQKLTVGNSVERVEQLMGQPDEVRPRWDNEDVRTYVYRVFPPYFAHHSNPPEMFSTRWMIDINEEGQVVGLRREDKPC